MLLYLGTRGAHSALPHQWPATLVIGLPWSSLRPAVNIPTAGPDGSRTERYRGCGHANFKDDRRYRRNASILRTATSEPRPAENGGLGSGPFLLRRPTDDARALPRVAGMPLNTGRERGQRPATVRPTPWPGSATMSHATPGSAPTGFVKTFSRLSTA